MRCKVITKCNQKIDKSQDVQTFLKMCTIYCEAINLQLKVVSRFHKSKNRFSKSSQVLSTPQKRDVLMCKITLGSHHLPQTNWLPYCQIQTSLRVEPCYSNVNHCKLILDPNVHRNYKQGSVHKPTESLRRV